MICPDEHYFVPEGCTYHASFGAFVNAANEDCMTAITYQYPDCQEGQYSAEKYQNLDGVNCPHDSSWVRIEGTWMHEGSFEYDYNDYTHQWEENDGTTVVEDTGMDYTREPIRFGYTLHADPATIHIWDGTTELGEHVDGEAYSMYGPNHRGSLENQCRMNFTFGTKEGE
jgi:hypothetical protein